MKAFLPTLLLLAACCGTSEPCIVPPPMETNEQHQIAVGIAATLSSLPVGGNLSTNFQHTVHNNYDKLADNDKSLYLFLIAIDCYLKEGEVGQDIAKQMVQIVREKWSKKEIAANPNERDLRPDLKKIDKRTPAVAGRIHQIMKKLEQE